MTDVFFGCVLGVVLCAIVDLMRRVVLAIPGAHWSRRQRIGIELGAAAAILGGTLAACGSPDAVRCQLDAIRLLPAKPAELTSEEGKTALINVVSKLNDCRVPVAPAATPAPVQDAGK
jgi:hypothetical protein